MSLANTMDEFCEEAIRLREVSGLPAGNRCLFCRTSEQYGTCFGLLREVNRAILHGRWERARDLAKAWIGQLESMDLSSVATTRPARA